MKPKVRRILAVGAGPANLSFAALSQSLCIQDQLSVDIIERRHSAEWHPGQLIPGARLLSEWYRDLVTTVDPTNPHSFLNFLKSKNKLIKFINAGVIFPTRRDYSDYFMHVSSELGVKFGCECIGLSWDRSSNLWEAMILDAGLVKSETYDGIVLGLGAEPYFPPGFETAQANVIHAAAYLSDNTPLEPETIAVIGGSQSAAEIVLDQISRKPNERLRRIIWVTKGTNYHVLDTGAFAREFYSNSYKLLFNSKSQNEKLAIVNDTKRAFGGISPNTSDQLYSALVELRDIEIEFVLNAECFLSLSGNPCFRNVHSGEVIDISADVYFMCTGFMERSHEFIGTKIGLRDFQYNSDFTITDNIVGVNNLYSHYVDGDGQIGSETNFVTAPQRSAVIINSLLKFSALYTGDVDGMICHDWR